MTCDRQAMTNDVNFSPADLTIMDVHALVGGQRQREGRMGGRYEDEHGGLPRAAAAPTVFFFLFGIRNNNVRIDVRARDAVARSIKKDHLRRIAKTLCR